MVRSPTRDKSHMARYLEDGAAGLMMPFVSTADEARSLVESTKFPPLGERGVDAAGLDADFAMPDPVAYAADANQETFLVVQIETPEAVENVEEIASVEGVDGLFVGPGDLGVRRHHASGINLSIEDVETKVAEVAARHGKAWGRPSGDFETLERLAQKGAQLLAYGGEFLGMMRILQQGNQDFDKICGQ